jgi:hypothetical protein
MVRRCILALALMSLFVSLAWSQASMGSVNGTVRDQSGAVIPGASVVLINSATNNTLRSNTNEVGFYLFPAVVPGQFRISVEQPGMAKYEATLTVQVQQSAVVDAVLKPAGTSTTVDVADVTPMVTVDNPTLGHVLERQRIEQLPINGRSVTSLLQTVPGMEGNRAHGMRENSQELILDGAALTDKLWGGNPARQPALDSIQEFRVENNSSSAKFARPTSIILSTKSGTNSLHGTAFETNRNNGYGVARARQDGNDKPPFLNRNEFGISAGGPVYIPKVYNGKNKTFWFFAYEGSRNLSPYTYDFAVPTNAMRQGDFRGLLDDSNRLTKIYDPWSTDPVTWSRQQYAYGGQANVIDPNKISPLAKTLFGITPTPTRSDVNPLLGNNLSMMVPQNTRQWTTSSRVDHRFSDKDQVYVRYTKQKSNRISWFDSVPMLNGVAGIQQTTVPSQSGAISHVHSFSPTLFNELLVSVNREVAYKGTGEPGVKYADQLGLPNPFNVAGWPGIYYTGIGYYYFETQNAKNAPFTYGILDDNVTKIKGRHEFQFGFHTRYDQLNFLPDQQHPQGNHDFNVNATSLYDPTTPRDYPDPTAYTGHNLANLFLGQAEYSNSLVHPYFYARGHEYSMYFQDNIRLTPRLTLNLGVRWEYWPAYREKNGMLTSFDPANKAVVLQSPLSKAYALQATLPSIVNTVTGMGVKFEDAAAAGLPSTLMNDNKKNFGPRIGFAYRAGDGKKGFVLRGGFRSSYFPIPLFPWAARMRMNVPFSGRFRYAPDDSSLSPDGVQNYTMRTIPTIIAGANSRNVINLNNADGINRGSPFVSYFGKNQADSRVDDWNLTFEKEVMPNTVIRAGYVGNHSSHLELYNELNNAPTGYVWMARTGTRPPGGPYSNVATRPFDQTVYGTVEEYQKAGYGNFGGGQFEIERRFSKGFGYQLFYNIGNTFMAGGQSYSGQVASVMQFLPNAVPTDFDQRNRFLNYQRDASVPKHRVRWNWIADLPFGKGKLIGGNAGPVLNRLIGGWQVAGMGSLWTTFIALPTNLYPTGNAIQQYGYQYPIQDCRSGQCRPGYLWYNGYINPNLINKPNGIMGLPADYKPAAQPLHPWPVNPSASDPMLPYYGGNTVWVPLKDGSTVKTTYNDNLNPWRNQYLPSTRQWMLDASLFKNIPIKERLSARLNVDMFNVLNHPGNPTGVNSEGILYTNYSGQGARQMQLTLRLLW